MNEIGNIFGLGQLLGIQAVQPQHVAQLQAAHQVQLGQQWSGMNPILLQNVAYRLTQWELDRDEAMKVLDEIAPGWKDDGG